MSNHSDIFMESLRDGEPPKIEARYGALSYDSVAGYELKFRNPEIGGSAALVIWIRPEKFRDWWQGLMLAGIQLEDDRAEYEKTLEEEEVVK